MVTDYQDEYKKLQTLYTRGIFVEKSILEQIFIFLIANILYQMYFIVKTSYYTFSPVCISMIYIVDIKNFIQYPEKRDRNHAKTFFFIFFKTFIFHPIVKFFQFQVKRFVDRKKETIFLYDLVLQDKNLFIKSRIYRIEYRFQRMRQL